MLFVYYFRLVDYSILLYFKLINHTILPVASNNGFQGVHSIDVIKATGDRSTIFVPGDVLHVTASCKTCNFHVQIRRNFHLNINVFYRDSNWNNQ